MGADGLRNQNPAEIAGGERQKVCRDAAKHRLPAFGKPAQVRDRDGGHGKVPDNQHKGFRGRQMASGLILRNGVKSDPHAVHMENHIADHKDDRHHDFAGDLQGLPPEG